MTPRRLLLDSHVFVWLLVDDRRITPRVRALIGQSEATFISYVSLQELTFKYKSGKFSHSPENLFTGVEQAHLEILPMRPKHLLLYPRITLPHKDPFDTLLIAQATAEGMPLVTADNTLTCSDYEVIDARV